MKIKKYLLIIILAIITIFSFNIKAYAKKVNVYMFYGETCPHCEEAIEYLDNIKDKYNLDIIKYEVWNNDENKKLMNEVSDFLDVNPVGVPFVIIDNTPIFGYSKGITADIYKYHIKLASKRNFVDKVGIKLGVVKGSLKEDKIINNNNIQEEYNLYVPFIWNVDFKNINIYLSSIILGILDGLNPGMLFVFIIIFALLCNKKNNKVKNILPVILLLSLNVFYAIFININNIDNYISYISLIRVLLSLMLILFGAINLYSYAEDIDDKNNKKENKIIKFLKSKKVILSFIIMILFGILLSFIKIANVSDLYIVFNNLLSNASNKPLVMILYSLFVFIINIILFSLLLLVVKLFNKTKLSNNYKLISGILFFVIGIFIILKPNF